VKPVLLGAYRLIAKLGRGRVTDVYLATREGQTSKEDLLVIKRLRTGKSTLEEALRVDDVQVATDAALATQLHHPNIATIFELNQSGTAPFWAMEYVEGQPLDRLLSAANRAGGLPVSFGLRILCDLLAALEYAHNLQDDSGRALGIVHRDVRPHNIFVSYTGALKLLDFGIPRPSREQALAAPRPEGGRASYVAPEQALSGSVDRRADVFAVGLVMWELLSKRRRANTEIPLGTLHGLQPELTTEQGSLNADLNAELSRISDRALERDPQARYANAAQMLVELEAALEKLGDPRCSTAAMARANLGNLVVRLFKNERNDAARRIQLLLAVDTVAPTTTLDASDVGIQPEPNKPKANGSRPPPLRVSRPDTSLRAEPSESSIPHLVTPASVRPDPGPKSSSDGRAAAAFAAVLILFAGVGVTWSLTRPEPKQETQTAAISASAEPIPSPVLRLCGSNTVGAELAPALVEALFASKDSAAKLSHKRNIDSDVTQLVSRADDKTLSAEVTARGTATAFTGLAKGQCDVGMASRAIDSAEAERLKDQGIGDLASVANEHVIALDGVAVVVHPNNPLSALDRQALHAVFTGKVSDWSEVGGKAGPIHVIARDDQSGTYDTFQHLVLGQDKLIASAKRYVRSDALADAVASDPAAIGFVGLAYVRTAKALAVGEPGAAALLPTQFTVATEGYMLSRRLYLYTPDKPSSPWVTELVSFAMSARGQEIAAKAGFVSLTLLTDTMHCTGQCPPRYQATVEKAHRVSVDLRFRAGSDQPDSRARRDMDRLVNFLQNFREPKVLLLGFSDNQGNYASNQKLSQDRAKTISDDLARRGIHASVVTGFGPDMPVATNETEPGRQRNRRVEVWFEHE
jgi:phosphate transport system substrate-binding protein